MYSLSSIQEKQKLRKEVEKQKAYIEKLENRIEELEYELVCLDGLYVTDVYEDCWQLNLKPLINKGIDEDD